MQEFKNLIVLSVLAVFLVAGVVAATVVNPYALLGLAPVLLAVAAIVHAARGRHGQDNHSQQPRKTGTKPTRAR